MNPKETTPPASAASLAGDSTREPDSVLDLRERTMKRSSDAPLRHGNSLTLLKNGPDTFEQWLAEIEGAEKWVHMDFFIFKRDGIGRRFADAIMRKARDGVAVRVSYDWLGNLLVPLAFWQEMRQAGVEVRCVNRPSPASPLGVVLRDHRKVLAVDGRYASVGGLCIADQWLNRSPETGLPYRDTAVGIEGPVVADVERAFAGIWDLHGTPLSREERPDVGGVPAVGDQAARVVIQEPGKMRVLRTLQTLTSGLRDRFWIADAYFLSVHELTMGLKTAARDGVDVRILVPTPATNDQPPIGTLSRAGYRPLLESGVRIFEYAGPMMHAKTHVADGTLSRVGSTNLNVSGLVTNWEIDLFTEDRDFGSQMEGMFEADLADAREVRLESRGPDRRPRARPERPLSEGERTDQRNSRALAEPRALSTASRLGQAALQNTRESLKYHERAVVGTISAGLFAAGALSARFPKALAWPLSALLVITGVGGLLHAARPTPEREPETDDDEDAASGRRGPQGSSNAQGDSG